MSKQRYVWIDALRGFAVLLVILGHIHSTPFVLLQYIYSFHIPLFFIISGILFFLKKDYSLSFKGFIFKRATGLLFPYLTLSLLDIILSVIISFFPIKETNDIIGMIIDTFSLEGIGALWFLPALFLAETFLFLWIRLLLKKRIVVVVVLLFIVSITVCFSNLGTTDYEKNTLIFHILSYINIVSRALFGFVFLLVGYYLTKIVFTILNNNSAKGVIIQLLTAVVCGALHLFLFRNNTVDLHYSVIGNPLLFYANAVFGSYAMIIVFRLVGKESKVFSFFGKNSLIVFATHLNFSVITVCQYVNDLLRISEPFGFIFVFFAVICIEFLLVLVVNKFFSWFINYNRFCELLIKLKKKKES